MAFLVKKRHEAVLLVERLGLNIDGIHLDRVDADRLGQLQRAPNRIEEEHLDYGKDSFQKFTHLVYRPE